MFQWYIHWPHQISGLAVHSTYIQKSNFDRPGKSRKASDFLWFSHRLFLVCIKYSVPFVNLSKYFAICQSKIVGQKEDLLLLTCLRIIIINALSIIAAIVWHCKNQNWALSSKFAYFPKVYLQNRISMNF